MKFSELPTEIIQVIIEFSATNQSVYLLSANYTNNLYNFITRKDICDKLIKTPEYKKIIARKIFNSLLDTYHMYEKISYCIINDMQNCFIKLCPLISNATQKLALDIAIISGSNKVIISSLKMGVIPDDDNLSNIISNNNIDVFIYMMKNNYMFTFLFYNLLYMATRSRSYDIVNNLMHQRDIYISSNNFILIDEVCKNDDTDIFKLFIHSKNMDNIFIHKISSIAKYRNANKIIKYLNIYL
jgi:hypothetical protein